MEPRPINGEYEVYGQNIAAAKLCITAILREYGGKAPIRIVRGDPRLRVFISEEITAACGQLFSDLRLGYADDTTAYVLLGDVTAHAPSLSAAPSIEEWGPAIKAAKERKQKREAEAILAMATIEQYINNNPKDFAPPGLLISAFVSILLDIGLGVSHEAYLQAISNACRYNMLQRVLPGRLMLPEEFIYKNS